MKERVKEFSKNLRLVNKRAILEAQQRGRRPKQRERSKREKAAMYADTISRPTQMVQSALMPRKKKSVSSDDSEGKFGYAGQKLSQLDELELEHEEQRYSAEAIRSSYSYDY